MQAAAAYASAVRENARRLALFEDARRAALQQLAERNAAARQSAREDYKVRGHRTLLLGSLPYCCRRPPFLVLVGGWAGYTTPLLCGGLGGWGLIRFVFQARTLLHCSVYYCALLLLHCCASVHYCTIAPLLHHYCTIALLLHGTRGVCDHCSS